MSTRTPATKLNATPGARRATRSVGWAIAAFVVVLGGAVGAVSNGIENAATVSSPAVRIPNPDQGLLFPIDPEPVCEVLNNFGGYSKYLGGNGHQGLDIGTALAQEVYAVETGTLYRRFDGSGSGLGWGLWSDTDVKYRYFHLDSLTEALEVGDRVERGDIIGYTGDTGNASPGGYHLHFEVRPGPHPQFGSTDPIDPLPLLDVPSSCNVY